jgi:hypothetical protein
VMPRFGHSIFVLPRTRFCRYSRCRFLQNRKVFSRKMFLDRLGLLLERVDKFLEIR